MANNEGTPLHGDRSAWNTTDFDGEHARDIDEDALLRHLPAPDAANNFSVDNGTNWVSKTLAQVVALVESLLDHGNIQGLGDGSDHSFIDQDVTAGSSPNFDGTNFTGVAVDPDYSDVSGNDAATDVTAAELEELTDASETALHSHAITADYSDISGNDAGTDISAAELEELSDGSETTLHSHAGGGDVVDDLTPQLGGDLDLNGHGIDFPTTPNITDVLDEDDMASDSATKLATQQSIKKYVDDNAGGGGSGVSVGGAFAAEWKIDGVMAVAVEVGGAFIVPDDSTITAVLVNAKDPGSAGSTILDVNINGTTAYTTQGNRPTLAYDDADDTIVATDPDDVDVVTGDILTIDIDQVATGASGLSVTILLVGTEEIDYTFVSATDADTDVTGLELEELTDGSETTLHSHAGGGGADILEMQVFS